jgi:hypothetical protein
MLTQQKGRTEWLLRATMVTVTPSMPSRYSRWIEARSTWRHRWMHRRLADAGTAEGLNHATPHQLRTRAWLPDLGACGEVHDEVQAPGRRVPG